MIPCSSISPRSPWWRNIVLPRRWTEHIKERFEESDLIVWSRFGSCRAATCANSHAIRLWQVASPMRLTYLLSPFTNPSDVSCKLYHQTWFPSHLLSPANPSKMTSCCRWSSTGWGQTTGGTGWPAMTWPGPTSPTSESPTGKSDHGEYFLQISWTFF